MRFKDYHFTAPQLAIMSDSRLSEAMMQLFTQIISVWDENDRSKDFFLRMPEIMDLMEGQKEGTIRNDIACLKGAELVLPSMTGGKYKLHLTDDGIAAAKYILDSKDTRRYKRLHRCKDYPGRGWQKMYTSTMWERMLVTYHNDIIKVDTRKAYGEESFRYIYVDIKKEAEILDFLTKYKRTDKEARGLRDAPKMLLDKIAMFKGKERPQWLEYDIQQYLKSR